MNWKSRRGLYLAAILLIVVIIIFILMLVFKPKPATQPTTVKPRPVKAKKITIGDHRPQIMLYGVVESTQLAKQKAKIRGTIAKVLVKEGQSVKKGQLLIQIGTAKLKLQVMRRAAQAAEIKGRIAVQREQNLADQEALAHEKKMLVVADRERARMQTLVKQRFVSQTVMEKSEAEHARMELNINKRQHSLTSHKHVLTQLEANLKQAEADLGLAKEDLKNASLKAPFDGTVNEVYVSVGGHVDPGQSLVEVLSSSGYRIRATLPNNYLAVVSQELAGAKVVNARAKWQQYWGDVQLRAISTNIEAGQVSKDLLFTMNQKRAFVALGQSVIVYLPLLPIPGTAEVPLSALHGSRVYKIVNNHLQAAAVKRVGDRFNTDGNHEVLLKGETLETGDWVLISELPEAINGLSVSIRP